LQQQTEVAEACGGSGVFLAQSPAADLQGTLTVRARRRQIVHHLQQGGQVGETAGGVGMVLTQHSASLFTSLDSQIPCLLMPPEVVQPHHPAVQLVDLVVRSPSCHPFFLRFLHFRAG
jgi:hypothetical protein